MLGAHVLVAHLAEVARARVGALDHHLRWRSRASAATVSSAVVYHQIASRTNASRCSGSTRSGSGRKPDSASSAVQRRRRRPRRPPAGRPARARRGSRSMRLNRPKSRNATRPSSSSRKLPGMGIARELAVAVQAAEEEAEHDLADPVALGLRAVLQLLEADALDELADEHALARERADDLGHDDERVAARRCARASAGSGPRARSRAPRRSARGSPSAIAFASSPGVIRLSSRMIMSRFCMSARTAAATPGYWTLTATSRPSRSVAR